MLFDFTYLMNVLVPILGFMSQELWPFRVSENLEKRQRVFQCKQKMFQPKGDSENADLTMIYFKPQCCNIIFSLVPISFPHPNERDNPNERGKEKVS